MTPETFLVVVLLLVVKYTLEFADRRRWRAKRRRRRTSAPRPAPRAVPASAPGTASPPAPAAPGEVQSPTGDPYWDMVNDRIATLPRGNDARRA